MKPTMSTGERSAGLQLITTRVGRPVRRPGAGALFLDRDGVINERIIGGYVLSRAELEFCDGFLKAFENFRSLETTPEIIIVSNQACVGKGLLTLPTLREIMLQVVERLEASGIYVSAWLVCPHESSDDCFCRKPKPGMLFESARRFAVDLSRSCFVGDSQTDIDAGAAAGCNTFLVNSKQPASFSAARSFVNEVLIDRERLAES